MPTIIFAKIGKAILLSKRLIPREVLARSVATIRVRAGRGRSTRSAVAGWGGEAEVSARRAKTTVGMTSSKCCTLLCSGTLARQPEQRTNARLLRATKLERGRTPGLRLGAKVLRSLRT